MPEPYQPLSVEPELVQPVDDGTDDERAIQPLSVHRLGGTLPFETNGTQLQCGTTVTDNSGDQNNRLILGAIVTLSQFETLAVMRENPESILLYSPAFSGPVTFDELKWDRIPEANGAVLPDGTNVDEPLYDITLQQKETDESDSEGIIEQPLTE